MGTRSAPQVRCSPPVSSTRCGATACGVAWSRSASAAVRGSRLRSRPCTGAATGGACHDTADLRRFGCRSRYRLRLGAALCCRWLSRRHAGARRRAPRPDRAGNARYQGIPLRRRGPDTDRDDGRSHRTRARRARHGGAQCRRWRVRLISRDRPGGAQPQFPGQHDGAALSGASLRAGDGPGRPRYHYRHGQHLRSSRKGRVRRIRADQGRPTHPRRGGGARPRAQRGACRLHHRRCGDRRAAHARALQGQARRVLRQAGGHRRGGLAPHAAGP